MRSKELAHNKLQDQLKLKLFEKAGKQQVTGSMETLAPAMASDIKFSKIGGDGDFNLMITKS